MADARMPVMVRKDSVVAGAGPQGPQSGNRNSILDFTKGVLVLFMLLYHWCNYFAPDGTYYRYIRFVTASFILVSGFLISNVYCSKYKTGGAFIAKRLFQRGAKLLILFTALNIGANAVVSRNYNDRALGLDVFASNAKDIYIVGKGEFAAFEILVPIAYLLITSGLIFVLNCRIKYCFLVVCASLFGGVWLVSRKAGFVSANLNWLAVGVLGLVFGSAPIGTVNALAQKLSYVTGIYVAYCALITFMGTPYWLQVAGAVLSVLLIYSLGVKLKDGGHNSRGLELLGQYSLLGYISQIAALQLLRRFCGLANSDALSLLTSLLGAAILTIGAVVSIHYLRLRFRSVTNMYEMVFS
jgi:hypothetical protein